MFLIFLHVVQTGKRRSKPHCFEFWLNRQCSSERCWKWFLFRVGLSLLRPCRCIFARSDKIFVVATTPIRAGGVLPWWPRIQRAGGVSVFQGPWVACWSPRLRLLSGHVVLGLHVCWHGVDVFEVFFCHRRKQFLKRISINSNQSSHAASPSPLQCCPYFKITLLFHVKSIFSRHFSQPWTSVHSLLLTLLRPMWYLSLV